jgi:competence protein ComEC
MYLFTFGYGLTVHVSERFEPDHFSLLKADSFLVRIQNEPKLSRGILRFEAEVIRIYDAKTDRDSKGKIQIAVSLDSTDRSMPEYGDMMLIPADYQVIDPPYNPGEFDYKTLLGNRQIYFQSFIRRDQFLILAWNTGNPIISFALILRKKLISRYNAYLPDQDAAALASALILGYRADLNKDIIEAYSKTGTMHVLSVSGMHVGIVFLVLSVLLRPFGQNKFMILTRTLSIISSIWFYSLITGFSSPVCRAALMISFVVSGKALNRNQNTYNLIAISAFFLLLNHPFYLFDVGFQLSYLAVCGLVYFHPKLYHSLYFKNRVIDYAWSYCALSIAAQLATFPLSLYYFHQFPLYFLLSNLLIVLPVTIIMYAGILILIIPFSAVLRPIGYFLNEVINLTNRILFEIENLPFASVSGIRINVFQLFLVCALILLLAFLTRSRQKIIAWTACSIGLVLSVSFSVNDILNLQRNELIFYSLRKNTAIGYFSDGRGLVLTDIEPSDRLYSFSIKPALEIRGDPETLIQKIENPVSGEQYWSDSNFMQFGKFKILRWNKNINLTNSGYELNVDILLLSGNPYQKLIDIRTCVAFKAILIDATNSDYKIKGWLSEASKLNIPCHVLKKSPAYIVKL